MSLRRRLLVGIFAVAAVLIVTNTVLSSTFHSFLLARVDNQLGQVASRTLRDERFRGPLRVDQQTVTEYYIAFADVHTGRIEYLRSPLDPPDKPLPNVRPAHLQRAVHSPAPTDVFTVSATSGEDSWRVLLIDDPRATGRLNIVGSSLHELDTTVARIRTVQLAATLAVLAALGIVAWWVVRLGVDPIESMAKTADAIAAGDLSHRVTHTDERTEAGRLGVALNSMLSGIQEAFTALEQSEARVRRFAADASHELRTPLTSIQGYTELWRAGGLQSKAELAEAMRRMEQEAKRMGALVEDLLLLARLDQRRPLERRPVRLDVIAADSVRDARAVEPARPIELHASDEITVEGDEMRLRQVVANLLANARVHTPAGTPVRVAVAQRDGVARIEVADEGPGMEPAIASRVFERFFRADASRARAAGGSGLGLSIVAAIAEAHGGSASVESKPGAGSRFFVDLPASTAAVAA